MQITMLNSRSRSKKRVYEPIEELETVSIKKKAKRELLRLDRS